MVTTKLQTESLNRLGSKDQLDLLDVVDRLRSHGVNELVSLPQVIVCGDQSSGISSVLEAISHVSFRAKSSVCTRFPTELVLRRALHNSSSVSIVPHPSHSIAEVEALQGFHRELEGFDCLPNIVGAAQNVMEIHNYGKTFSEDLLKIEIAGPDSFPLTIVDVPSLIHSGTEYQTADDIELIKDIVKGYSEYLIFRRMFIIPSRLPCLGPYH